MDDRPSRQRQGPRPSDLGQATIPDFALVLTIGVPPAGGPVMPGVLVDDSLMGLLRYVMLSPAPAGSGSDGQAESVKSALAYLVSRADALVRAGRGHLVAEAAHARLRGDELPPRSYVAETIRDTVCYLCPAIAEEAALNRPPRRNLTVSGWPQDVIVPGSDGTAGSNGSNGSGPPEASAAGDEPG